MSLISITFNNLRLQFSAGTSLSLKFQRGLVTDGHSFWREFDDTFVWGARQNDVRDPLTVITTVCSIDSVNQPLITDSNEVQNSTIRIESSIASFEKHMIERFISKDDHVRFNLRYYRCVDLRTFHLMAIAEISEPCCNKDLSHSYQFWASTESSSNCYWCWDEIVFVIWRERPSLEPLIWHLISCKRASDNYTKGIWFLRTVQDPSVRRDSTPIEKLKRTDTSVRRTLVAV